MEDGKFYEGGAVHRIKRPYIKRKFGVRLSFDLFFLFKIVYDKRK